MGAAIAKASVTRAPGTASDVFLSYIVRVANVRLCRRRHFGRDMENSVRACEFLDGIVGIKYVPVIAVVNI